MFKHKQYSEGFSIDGSVSDIKYKFISSRYRGKGRPRKKDYDYKNLMEIKTENDKTLRNEFNKALFSQKERR